MSGCVTVCFGLFPVTPMFHTSLFRSDPAHEHLINRLKRTSATALVNKSINIFNNTYWVIVAAPSQNAQEQLQSISVIHITFVF